MLWMIAVACATKTAQHGRSAATIEAALQLPSLPACRAIDEDAPLQLADQVDLLRVASSSQRYTVEQPQFAMLDSLTAVDAQALLTHLAADPDWRVHRRAGTLVAEQRHGDSVPASGYHDEAGDTWRILLRFEPWPEAASWAGSPLISVSQASSGKVVMRGFRASNDRTGTAVSIRGPFVSMELLELTSTPGRPHTAQAMRTLFPAISWQILSPGQNLPLDSGGDRLEISLLAGGTSEVRAWLNPGQPGTTWLRLFDGSGASINPEAIACATAEQTGWSTDEQRFYLQGQFPSVGARRAELWFQPLDASAARLLYSAAVP